MMGVTFILITSLILLYFYDHLFGTVKSKRTMNVPIKGVLVTGILYYLVSKELMNQEDALEFENATLEEVELFVTTKNILTTEEWGNLCLEQCKLHLANDIDVDIPC
ncbi:hypothetical protein [Sutcliffiella rhizosphaerae]|uniref:Uncharacterized protein n=1 Tax=Sutcliffiella rhizosphaerae TaxID=2880967 RepID=A0ABM8YIY2_9BACI|nr:hypothetical protein [Sutcliffiella rhizosphaerae]CAG9619831.1 hypothetical protein BACCIP111883_00599 [Sutcliffiella rhizosphaerae]